MLTTQLDIPGMCFTNFPDIYQVSIKLTIKINLQAWKHNLLVEHTQVSGAHAQHCKTKRTNKQQKTRTVHYVIKQSKDNFLKIPSFWALENDLVWGMLFPYTIQLHIKEAYSGQAGHWPSILCLIRTGLTYGFHGCVHGAQWRIACNPNLALGQASLTCFLINPQSNPTVCCLFSSLYRNPLCQALEIWRPCHCSLSLLQ